MDSLPQLPGDNCHLSIAFFLGSLVMADNTSSSGLLKHRRDTENQCEKVHLLMTNPNGEYICGGHLESKRGIEDFWFLPQGQKQWVVIDHDHPLLVNYHSKILISISSIVFHFYFLLTNSKLVISSPVTYQSYFLVLTKCYVVFFKGNNTSAKAFSKRITIPIYSILQLLAIKTPSS